MSKIRVICEELADFAVRIRTDFNFTVQSENKILPQRYQDLVGIQRLRLRLQIGANAAPGFTKRARMRSHQVSSLTLDPTAAQHGFQQRVSKLPVKNRAIENRL